MSRPPAGYIAWPHPSPLLDGLGELWQHAQTRGRFGFPVDRPKRNARELLHAGAIATIADVCLGHTMAASTDPPTPLVTANLNVTFVGPGHRDRWIDVFAQAHRVGRRIATGEITFLDEDRIVAQATAVFIPLPRTP